MGYKQQSKIVDVSRLRPVRNGEMLSFTDTDTLTQKVEVTMKHKRKWKRGQYRMTEQGRFIMGHLFAGVFSIGILVAGIIVDKPVLLIPCINAFLSISMITISFGWGQDDREGLDTWSDILVMNIIFFFALVSFVVYALVTLFNVVFEKVE